MTLDLKQIKAISTGAVRVWEDNEGIKLCRFTEEQVQAYVGTEEYFPCRCLTNAGMKFAFKTNSKKLFIKMKVIHQHARRYFSLDVTVNGKPVGYIDNFADAEDINEYIHTPFLRENYEKEFDLGEGEKRVYVYLPWSLQAVFEEVSLDEGSFIEPLKEDKLLLAFGDSITQGYDAMRPSNRHITQLAAALGADELNKAIGGDCFFPKLAGIKEGINPDYITVAYGTNDWVKRDRDTFLKNSKLFYSALSQNYPQAKIFAITPIWRADYEKQREIGPFEIIEQGIREAVLGLENVTLLNGLSFIPEETKYYADGHLHPNDEGFAHYFKNLSATIQQHIKEE